MRDDLAIYLTQTAEFGGQRFGPYEGMEVRLGSSPERSNIVIPEFFGVAKDHARVLRAQDTGLVIAPSERTAGVWLWKADARRPVQVVSATAMRSGDAIALGSPDGPRFVVEIAPLPADVVAKRKSSKRGIGNLTGDKLAQAGWSLFLARLYAFSPIGMAMNVWYRIKSGAIFNPRNFLLMLMGGAAMVGPMAGAAIAWFKGLEIERVKEENESLKADRDAAGTGSGVGIENQTPDELYRSVLKAPTLAGGMQAEADLQTAVASAAKRLVNTPDLYRWLIDPNSLGDPRVAQFVSTRKMLEALVKSEDLDAITASYLLYASTMGTQGATEFDIVKDSSDAHACTRGPLRLTYRQAKSLGLNAQVDFVVEGEDMSSSKDLSILVQKMIPALQAAGVPTDPLPTIQFKPVNANGVNNGCAYVEGDDERTRDSSLKQMVKTQFGTDASDVPSAAASIGALGRIAKLYAADIKGNNYANSAAMVTFRNGVASGLAEQSAWPLQRSADAMARAAIIPCKARMAHDYQKLTDTFGKLPEQITCLVYIYRLQNE